MLDQPSETRPVGYASRHPNGLRAILAVHATKLCFATIAVVAVVYARGLKENPLTFDAGLYWQSTDSFFVVKDGVRAFHLTQYHSAVRGYAFPILLLGIKGFAAGVGVDPLSIFALLSSLTFALLLAVLTPALWRAMTGAAASTAGRWTMAAVGLFLWRGYVSPPLTDLYALTALVGALVCFSVIRSEARPRARVLASIGVGALASLALNFRPAYLLATVVLGVLCVVVLLNRRTQALVNAGALIGAAALVLAPQTRINQVNFRTWSPLPQVSRAFSGRGLFLQQLSWGLEMQRYETNVSKDLPGGVRFPDPVGASVLKSQPRGSFDSYKQYVSTVLGHPLDTAAVFCRHAFNGIDLWYPTTYVDDPRRIRWGTMAINVLTWLLTFLQLQRAEVRKQLQQSYAYLIVLLLPVAVAVPVAVETRYFWPAHLLGNVIAFYPVRSWSLTFAIARRHWAFLLLITLLWIALSRSTFAALRP